MSRSTDRSFTGIWLRLFRTKHHCILWIFPDSDTALLGATMGSCLWLFHVGRLGLGQDEASFPLHVDSNRHRDHWLCDTAERHKKSASEICRTLPRDVWLLLRHASHSVLVYHEPRWSSQAVGWQRLADRVRQHWRHHRHIRLPAKGCPAVQAWIQYLHRLHLSFRGQLRRLLHVSLEPK